MKIQSNTRLMPNPLPGEAPSQAFDKIIMMPADNGQSLLFTLLNGDLLVWITKGSGFDHWDTMFFLPAEYDLEGVYVHDFDVRVNEDDKLDVIIMGVVNVVETPVIFWQGAIDAQNSSDYWMTKLNALPWEGGANKLILPQRQHPLERVEWGVLETDWHQQARLFITWGREENDDGIVEAVSGYWGVPDPKSKDSYDLKSFRQKIAEHFPQSGPTDAFTLRTGALPAELQGEVSEGAYVCLFTHQQTAPGHFRGNAGFMPVGEDIRWMPGFDRGIANVMVDPDQHFGRKYGTGLYLSNVRGKGPEVDNGMYYDSAFQQVSGEFTHWRALIDPDFALDSDIVPVVNSPYTFVNTYPDPENPNALKHIFDLVHDASKATNYLRLTVLGPTDQWAIPYILASDVATFHACLCANPSLGEGVEVIHVTVSYTNGRTEILYQDQLSQMWQRRELLRDEHILEGQLATEVPAYTTHLKILDDHNLPQPFWHVAVTAQYPTTIYVGGQVQHISKVIPSQTLLTDADGTVDIITPVHNLGAPQYQLHLYPPTNPQNPLEPVATAEAKPELVHDLDVSSSLFLQLDKVKRWQDIQDARRSDGKKLFPNGIPELTCKSAYAKLDMLRKAREGILASSTPLSPEDHRKPYATPVPIERASVCWFEQGQWHSRQVAGGAFEVNGVSFAGFAGVGDGSDWGKPGDVLNWLSVYLQQGVENFTWAIKWTAENTYQFVANIAGKPYSFIMTVLSQVMDVLAWMLETVLGLKFSDMMAWLGYVYDWNDIVNNQDVIRQLYALSLDGAVGFGQIAQGQIGSMANKLKEELSGSLKLPDNPDFQELFDRSINDGPAKQDPMSDAFDLPYAQLGLRKFVAYGTGMSMSNVDLTAYDTGFLPLTDEQQKEVEELGSQVNAETIEEWANLPLNKLASDIQSLLSPALDTVIDISATFLHQVISSLETTLTNVRTIAATPIWVPVLSAYYKSTIRPGRDLTMEDAACLCVSIMATTAYKASQGKDLFTDAQRELIMASTDYNDFVRRLGGLGENPAGGSQAVGWEDRTDQEQRELLVTINIAVYCMKVVDRVLSLVNSGLKLAKITVRPLAQFAAFMILVRMLALLAMQATWYNLGQQPPTWQTVSSFSVAAGWFVQAIVELLQAFEEEIKAAGGKLFDVSDSVVGIVIGLCMVAEFMIVLFNAVAFIVNGPPEGTKEQQSSWNLIGVFASASQASAAVWLAAAYFGLAIKDPDEKFIAFMVQLFGSVVDLVLSGFANGISLSAAREGKFVPGLALSV